MEPAYNGTAGRLRAIQVLEVRIVVTPDPRWCKSFPLNTGFRCAPVPFKTGLLCTYACILSVYKGKVTPSTCHRRHRVDVYLHSFFISAVDGIEWSAQAPAALSPGKNPCTL